MNQYYLNIMKILITGSKGQLGSTLIKLKPTKAKIFAMNRNNFNMLNIPECLNVIKSLKPDWLINCGAYTNVDLANYTRAYFQMFNDYGLSSFVGTENDGVIRTAADLRGQGLRNGDLPASVYSLYGNHGTMYNGSAKQENTQTTFKASGSADIKDHEFSFGFEFEQRDDSYWGMGPMGMWGLMRQQANKHILQRDLNNPNPVFDINGVYQDTINYDRLYVAEEQSWFDRSLRQKLGLATNSTEYIDIDALSPEVFDIEMFSPDELLNSGSSLVYYYGYDIYGNKPTNTPTLASFFEEDLKFH